MRTRLDLWLAIHDSSTVVAKYSQREKPIHGARWKDKVQGNSEAGVRTSSRKFRAITIDLGRTLSGAQSRG